MKKFFNKEIFLEKFLEICQDKPWSDELIIHALKLCKIDSNLLPLIFDNDPMSELYNIFWENIDKETLKNLHNINKEKSTTVKISKIIAIRLDILQKYRSALSGFMQSCNSPKNLKLAIKLSYNFSDLAWSIIKDKSTDINYYTKRLILSKIYIKSLIFFNQNNVNNDEIIHFINKEITKTIKIGQIKKNFQKEVIADYFKKEIIPKIPFIRLKI